MPSFAGDGDHFHAAIRNFRNFQFKKPAHQLRVGPGQVDLHIGAIAVNPHHISLDAVTVLQLLSGDLFCGKQDSVLRFQLGTELDHNDAAGIGTRIALDDATDNAPAKLRIGIKSALGFSLAQLAQDGFAHGACAHAAKVIRGVIVLTGNFPGFGVSLGNDDADGTGGGIDVYPGLGAFGLTLRGGFAVIQVGIQQGTRNRLQQVIDGDLSFGFDGAKCLKINIHLSVLSIAG